MAMLAKAAFEGVHSNLEVVEQDVDLDMVAVVASAGNPDCSGEELSGEGTEKREGMEDDHCQNESLDGGQPAGVGENVRFAEGLPSDSLEEDGAADAARTMRRQQVMSIKTTNAADDYAHRGVWLKDFHFLGYEMYVRRVTLHDAEGHVWPFESHYPLASRYGQQIRATMAIPRLCNFKCPSMAENEEENAMMKSLLLTPVACPGRGWCHHVCRFNPALGMAPTPAASLASCGKPSFRQGWRARWHEIETEAAVADQKEQAAGKLLVLKDTTSFKAWLPPAREQRLQPVIKFRTCLQDVMQTRSCGDHAMRSLASFVCVRQLHDAEHCCQDRPSDCQSLHWGHHSEQCSLSEFMCHLARKVAINLDLAAESKALQKPSTEQAEDEESDGAEKQAEEQEVEVQTDLFGGDNDLEDDAGEDVADVRPRAPFRNVREAVEFALRKDELELAYQAKKCSKQQLTLKHYHSMYGNLLMARYPLRGLQAEGPQWHRHLGIQLRKHFVVAIEQQKQFFVMAVKGESMQAGICRSTCLI